MHTIETFAKFVDIFIVSNPQIELGYKIDGKKFCLFHRGEQFFGMTEVNDECLCGSLSWHLQQHCLYSLTTKTSVIFNEIGRHIKLKFYPQTIDWAPLHEFCITIADEQLANISHQFKRYRIPFKTLHDMNLNIAPVIYQCIPATFFPTDAVCDSFLNFEVCSSKQCLYYYANYTNKMIYLDFESEFDMKVYDGHGREKFFDPKHIINTRQNDIINTKYLLHLVEIFSTVMIKDIATIIVQLCFDLCYWDIS